MIPSTVILLLRLSSGFETPQFTNETNFLLTFLHSCKLSSQSASCNMSKLWRPCFLLISGMGNLYEAEALLNILFSGLSFNLRNNRDQKIKFLPTFKLIESKGGRINVDCSRHCWKVTFSSWQPPWDWKIPLQTIGISLWLCLSKSRPHLSRISFGHRSNTLSQKQKMFLNSLHNYSWSGLSKIKWNRKIK